MKKQIIVAALLAAGAANAASISYNAVIADQNTNWGPPAPGLLNLPTFDLNLGTLNSVSVKLDGRVVGTARVESLDGSTSTINTLLQATITASGPLIGAVQVIPAVSATDSFSAFDGVVDFGGTSGKVYGPSTGTDTDTITSVNPIVLAGYSTVGPGSVAFNVSASGSSTASGAGNIITQFSTKAGAKVTVTYNYSSTNVPDGGATMALLPVALLGLGLLRRRN